MFWVEYVVAYCFTRFLFYLLIGPLRPHRCTRDYLGCHPSCNPSILLGRGDMSMITMAIFS